MDGANGRVRKVCGVVLTLAVSMKPERRRTRAERWSFYSAAVPVVPQGMTSPPEPLQPVVGGAEPGHGRRGCTTCYTLLPGPVPVLVQPPSGYGCTYRGHGNRLCCLRTWQGSSGSPPKGIIQHRRVPKAGAGVTSTAGCERVRSQGKAPVCEDLSSCHGSRLGGNHQ